MLLLGSGGMKTFLLPRRNAKDLSDLPEVIRAELELIQVGTLDEVLEVALLPARTWGAACTSP